MSTKRRKKLHRKRKPINGPAKPWRYIAAESNALNRPVDPYFPLGTKNPPTQFKPPLESKRARERLLLMELLSK